MSGTPEIEYRIVPDLPDLIREEDYADPAIDKTIRVRITSYESGVEVLGDSPLPVELETLLTSLGHRRIDKVPCG